MDYPAAFDLRADSCSMKTRLILFVAAGLGLLTVAHGSMNGGWDVVKDHFGAGAGAARHELRVGFLPVT
jgi:hypothetical protein